MSKLSEMQAKEIKEINEFLNTFLLSPPDPSKDPEEPEEEMEMRRREFGWLNFPEVEVE